VRQLVKKPFHRRSVPNAKAITPRTLFFAFLKRANSCWAPGLNYSRGPFVDTGAGRRGRKALTIRLKGKPLRMHCPPCAF